MAAGPSEAIQAILPIAAFVVIFAMANRAATGRLPWANQCIDGFAVISMIRAGFGDKWNRARLALAVVRVI